MKPTFIRTLAIVVFASALAVPTLARAEGWFVKSFHHHTTTRDCIAKAAAAFRGIAGTIQRGPDVVYGYDLGGKNAYDAIIVCQRPKGARRDQPSTIAVMFALFDPVYSATTKEISRRFKDTITDRYKASMR